MNSGTLLEYNYINIFIKCVKNNYCKRKTLKGEKNMSSNSKGMVPEAREALDRFKMEAASEVGVNLKQGYNGHLTSREAGSVGGQMVKKMIEAYEKNMK